MILDQVCSSLRDQFLIDMIEIFYLFKNSYVFFDDLLVLSQVREVVADLVDKVGKSSYSKYLYEADHRNLEWVCWDNVAVSDCQDCGTSKVERIDISDKLVRLWKLQSGQPVRVVES